RLNSSPRFSLPQRECFGSSAAASSSQRIDRHASHIESPRSYWQSDSGYFVRSKSTRRRDPRWGSGLLVFALQAISSLARGEDVTRSRRVIFELAPQFRHVGIDSAGQDT